VEAFARATASLLLSGLIAAASAFEIKPVTTARGASDLVLVTEELNYPPEGKAWPLGHDHPFAVDCRSERTYQVFREAAQPVHETITRKAYRNVHGRSLKKEAWVQPLLAGVTWNDDPDYLLRKAWTDNGFALINNFVSRIKVAEKNPDGKDLLTRSHYGDLQFLHAMQGRGETQAQTLKKLHAWVEAAHRVATGDIPDSRPVDETPFRTAIGELKCGTKSCSVAQLLDRQRRFRGDIGQAAAQQNIREIAAGTVLHILQDAHSRSHTSLSLSTDGKPLRTLRTYDAENRKNHCVMDMASAATRPDIEAAIKVSTQYLQLMRGGEPWVEVRALLESIGLGVPPEPVAPALAESPTR
jgi:hypothetical protein